MKNKTSTQEHLNKINEFRQTIHTSVLQKRRDAQFELVDALLTNWRIGSFPELSLSPLFRCGWGSAYKAIETGSQDREGLTRYLVREIPKEEVWMFALDETVWPHPKSRVLEEQMYARSPTRSIKRYSIVQGHVYSILSWVPEAEGSWAPPVDSRRVTSQADAVITGAGQIDILLEVRRSDGQTSLIVITTDGGYSNERFNRVIAEREGVVKVGRMRCDRTLYREPGPYSGRGTRKRKHGAPFKFKDPTTWGTPVEDVTFVHHKFGQARRALGLGRIHPHDFRHYRATQLVEAGEPLDVVQEYLGHRSVEVTRQYYAHTREARVDEAARRVGLK